MPLSDTDNPDKSPPKSGLPKYRLEASSTPQKSLNRLFLSLGIVIILLAVLIQVVWKNFREQNTISPNLNSLPQAQNQPKAPQVVEVTPAKTQPPTTNLEEPIQNSDPNTNYYGSSTNYLSHPSVDILEPQGEENFQTPPNSTNSAAALEDIQTPGPDNILGQDLNSGSRPLSLGSSQCHGDRFTTPKNEQNSELSISELRWCMCQLVRIEVMKIFLKDPFGDKEFSAIQENYQLLCSTMPYSEDDAILATRSFQNDRLSIVHDTIVNLNLLGKMRTHSFYGFPPVSEGSALTVDSAEITLDAQRNLERLGFNRGSPNGIFSNETSLAIREFQKSVGLNEDGLLSPDIFYLLKATNASFF
jgi:hypothetical protein